ncbi:MAG: T9SS type A sorting domain-containing protein [Bacteroidetes bacterium]|nr:T9SS type A sorting domain-containing protein [Bacteroidota bacterium]
MRNKIFLLCMFMLTLQINIVAQKATDSNIRYKGIAIYIDYPDVPAWIDAERLDSLINGVNYQEEGASRSWRKYWYEQSRRNIDFTHDIFFYTAPQNSTYYESITWQEGILLWKNALEWIIANNPNYDWRSLSICDDNFDQGMKGGLLSVMIISSKWGPKGVGASHGPRWTLSNGIKINNLQGAVLKSPWDTAPVNLFMTLHETGHDIFAFPDTYDTDGGTDHSSGTGFYSLMSGGKPDVEPIGGPFLAQYNWGYIVEPVSGANTITLRADGDSVLVFRNPYDPNEYFTIEARKKNTIGNSLFPVDIGLLIWHTDSKVSTSNRLSDMTPSKHYRHAIEQADGLFQLEKLRTHQGNRGNIFVPGKSFTNSTVPDSKWWDGRSSGFEITDIQIIGADQIQFDVTIQDPPSRFPEIPQSAWRLISATPSQYGYSPSKAFDGDKSTYYHVPWGNTHPRPHEIVIDLGQLYVINEFNYQANTNTVSPWEGRIADYNLYLSEDGIEWGNPVVSGQFFYTGLNQYSLFQNSTGRYVKFEAINSWLWDASQTDVRTSIAEINFRGTTPASKAISSSIGEISFNIFPNPVGNELIVESTSIYECLIKIYNLNGSLLKTKAFRESTILDVANLSPGMYIIKLETAQVLVLKKLFKN